MALLIKKRNDRSNVEDNIDDIMTKCDLCDSEDDNEYNKDNKWEISDGDTNYIKLEDVEQKKKVVRQLLHKLDDREKTIITMFYGINEKEEPYTLDQISKRLSLSTERIRQLKVKAISNIEP